MSIHFPGGFSGPYRLIAPGHQAGQMNSPSNRQVLPVYVPTSMHAPMPQPYVMMAIPMPSSFYVLHGHRPPRPVRIHPPNHPPVSEAAKLLFKTISDKRPLSDVKKIMDSGVPLNVRSENGGTLMHEAACYERLDVIDELKRRGVNVDVQNAGGLTPLHEAALRTRIKSVRKLCSLRANANAKEKTGKTPLHYSCMIDGNAEVIHELLRAGAKVNECDHDGNTPMHIAAEHQLHGTMTQLKQKGGNSHQKNNKGMAPRDILFSVSNPAFARHVTIQLPQEPLQQPENGVSSPKPETLLPAPNPIKSKKAPHSIEPQALTAFQFVDPLAQLRTSIEPKNRSIAELSEIQTLLDDIENPFLKVDWALTEQRPKVKDALVTPAEPDQDANSLLEELELWLRENPITEPTDQNPASKGA